MKYVILIHSNPEPWGHPTQQLTAEGRTLSAEQHAEMDRTWGALMEEISASGEFVTAEALADPASSTLFHWSPRAPVHHRRALRRDQGAAGRLLPDRLCDPGAGRGDRVRLRPAGWHGRAATRHVGRRGGPVAGEDLWRTHAPQVLAALTRRYGDFDAAEDALQEALLAAARQWPSRRCPRTARRLADHRRVPVGWSTPTAPSTPAASGSRWSTTDATPPTAGTHPPPTRRSRSTTP